PSFVGSFKDEHISVELSKAKSDGLSSAYTGTIRMGEQTFPVEGKTEAGMLKGTFESQGDKFDFEATPDGVMLFFVTGGTTYHLQKQSVNPLARQPLNPLANPADSTRKQLTAPLQKSNDASAPPLPADKPPDLALTKSDNLRTNVASVGTLRFQKFSLM